MASQTRSAVIVKTAGNAVVESGVKVPKLQAGDILIRTTAVALNPVDHAFIDYMAQPGAVQGCDYAGVVEDIGESVDPSWKKGMRIAGFVHPNNQFDLEGGAFATIIKAPAALQMQVPDGLSDVEASTMGVGIETAGKALFEKTGLQLPSPTNPAKETIWVLVYGGSTATGAIAIQLAKAAGLQVVATCSPSSFEYCRSLGASHVFDYNSPTCGADIRAAVPNILHCVDCASKGESPAICAAALSASSGGRYCSVLPIGEFPRANVSSSTVTSFEIFGKRFFFGPTEFPACKEAFSFAKELMETATKLAAEGKLKPHKQDVRQGGLEAVLGGLDDLRAGKIRGAKVVVRL